VLLIRSTLRETDRQTDDISMPIVDHGYNVVRSWECTMEIIIQLYKFKPRNIHNGYETKLPYDKNLVGIITYYYQVVSSIQW